MKSNRSKKRSITKPLLKELVDMEKASSKLETPTIESEPLKPAELDQDPGSGYNPDHTFPQT